MVSSTAFVQWSPTTSERSSKMELSLNRNYYELDINQIRDQLRNAQEMGVNSKPLEILLPILSGKIENLQYTVFL